MTDYRCIICEEIIYDSWHAGFIIPIIAIHSGEQLCVCKECQAAVAKLKQESK